MKLIKSLKAYVQWESTIAYLKDPPQSYGLPPVDIQGGLDAIAANATAGSFQSEYDFQSSIVRLISLAHDGHFAYRPDVFKAFGFRNDLARDLVSLSVDGKQLPKLYNLGKFQKTWGAALQPDPPAISGVCFWGHILLTLLQVW